MQYYEAYVCMLRLTAFRDATPVGDVVKHSRSVEVTTEYDYVAKQRVEIRRLIPSPKIVVVMELHRRSRKLKEKL